MLTAQLGILALSVLWLMLCLRFWLAVGRENPGQRRLLAIAGGLGAGLIYVLGAMILHLLRQPSDQDSGRHELRSGEDVRISPTLPRQQ